MDTNKIKMTRILSSIPLNSVDENRKMPTSMGSGCFVNYKCVLIFLTVLHIHMMILEVQAVRRLLITREILYH